MPEILYLVFNYLNIRPRFKIFVLCRKKLTEVSSEHVIP